MSLNLAELQQKANQVLFNSDEAIRKWVEFISAPAGQVTLQYYDRNGNLQTASFDNRNKLVQNFISSVNSVMSKTFYVDAVNGNDANDGLSKNTAFASLSKALSSIPTGGHANIYLLSNLTVDNNSNPSVGKDNISAVIVRHSSLSSNPVITFSNNRIQILQGANNYIWFSDIDFTFNFSGLTSNVSLLMWNTHHYVGESGFNMGSGFGIQNSTITINTDTDYVIKLVESIPFIRFSSLTINYNNSTGNDMFKFTNADSCVKFEFYNSTLNINGTANTDIAGHIINIVRDTNGVPRNILSNIVL